MAAAKRITKVSPDYVHQPALLHRLTRIGTQRDYRQSSGGHHGFAAQRIRLTQVACGDGWTRGVTLRGRCSVCPGGRPPTHIYAQAGRFLLHVNFPVTYPFKPPVVHFATRIWHPNVTFDDKGSICVGILKSEGWKPSSRVRAVLEAIQHLLREPNPDDPLESSIANKYREDPTGWAREAREMTAKHALKK